MPFRRTAGVSNALTANVALKLNIQCPRWLRCRSNGPPRPCFSPASRDWQLRHALKPRVCVLHHISTRSFLVESIPTFLVPPAVFTGLLLSLWTYKCIMAVIFQDRIIYMPCMPPFARSEKIADYVESCKPVEWEVERIRSLDGTKISLAVGRIPEPKDAGNVFKRDVVICYFQGNGSSVPPRLPLLSQVLKLVHAQGPSDVRFTLVALSYRGYWTSSGKATQSGIELDAEALLKWVAETHPSPDTQVILWGQSIGAGVASAAAAGHLISREARLPMSALILETPFTSIKSMLFALYPQKWLPYKYLHPFLWNHWDNDASLRKISEAGKALKVLLISATRDEVVPAEEMEKIERLCRDLGLNYEKREVIGALHTDATTRREGQEAVAKFVLEVTKTDGR